MLSKYLITPLVLGALILLYLAWEVDDKFAFYVAPFGIGAAVVYILSPQIDWWWYQRHPPEIGPKLRAFIEAKLPFYQRLDEAGKQRFRNRMAMYMEAVDFQGKGMEDVPPELKAAIAACAVQLTLGREQDWLMEKFEHLIVYPHPFPSPQHQQWHACEHFEPDGAILFSGEQLLPGFLQPEKFFHIGLYEYARVFRACFPELPFPAFGEAHWPILQAISGFSKSVLEKWIGLPELDVAAVAVTHFFVFPERFQAALPDEYRQFQQFFQIGQA